MDYTFLSKIYRISLLVLAFLLLVLPGAGSHRIRLANPEIRFLSASAVLCLLAACIYSVGDWMSTLRGFLKMFVVVLQVGVVMLLLSLIYFLLSFSGDPVFRYLSSCIFGVLIVAAALLTKQVLTEW